MQAKPFRCDHAGCNKRFSTKFSLRRHAATHLDERPFSCEYCGKSFVLRQYLKEHIYTHTGEKPFVCRICGKSFRQAGKLSIHRKLHQCVGDCFSHNWSAHNDTRAPVAQIDSAEYSPEAHFPVTWQRVPETQLPSPPPPPAAIRPQPSFLPIRTSSFCTSTNVGGHAQSVHSPLLQPQSNGPAKLAGTLQHILFVQEKLTLGKRSW